MNRDQKTRRELIDRQKHQLFMPRVQMSTLLLLTGLVGFLSSFLLLHSGVSQMLLRYPLAILSAYVAFLLLLRLWLAYQRSQGDYDSYVDFDLPGDSSSMEIASRSSDLIIGHGGDFGGSGAGGSWGESATTTPSSSYSGGGSVLDSASFDIDLEELGLVIIAIVALIGGLFASLYIVYIAPILLAEILVDGLLLRGLYKRVENIEREYWLQTAIRKTLVPAILCVLCFGVMGGALQFLAPEAKSLGEVWRVMARGNAK